METTDDTIDLELIKKWITALESGNYKKCIGKLHKAGNSFCALGILCDVHDPTKWKYYKPLQDDSYYLYINYSEEIPNEIYEKIKTPETNIRTMIMHMNDIENKSFKEIAQYLREVYNIKD